MKPLLLASAMATMIAPMLGPVRAGAQAYGPQPSQSYRGYGSPGFHPPPHAPPNYGQPGPVSSRAAPHVPAAYDPERPGRSGWRKGQLLPPALRENVVSDYARCHLRRPPRGYSWYRDADDYVLAAIGTGLIFEVISSD